MALNKDIALITLEDAKRYLNIAETTTSDDRLIDALVMQASEIIIKEVGTGIIQQTYAREILSGSGNHLLFLNHWPLVRVDRVSLYRDDAFSVTYTGSGTHATVAVTTTELKLRYAESGTWNTQTFTISDYTTITNLAAAIDAISGWDTTVIDTFGSYPASEILPMPARSADSRNVYIEVPEECDSYYEIYDSNWSALWADWNWNKGDNNIVVDYVAGWTRENIPSPISGACMELVSVFYNLAKKDPTLRSEKIGDYSYTTVNVNNLFDESSVPGTVLMKIRPYRRTMVWGLL